MEKIKYKLGDIVLYVANNTVEIGRLGAKHTQDSWIIIPLAPFKNTVLRNEKFLRRADDVKKYLTNTK